MIEQGPFPTQILAEENCKSFSSQIEKPVAKGDFKWALIGLLAVLTFWLLSVGYRKF
jgi:hypothetical protein